MNPPPSLALREQFREQRFDRVWRQELNDVFADVAAYYDRANLVASLGMWRRLGEKFMAIIELHAGEKVLDVCAGTNAVGIALLNREPSLEVHAMDRSVMMQEVGQQRAQALGLTIESVIGDVHVLPFQDASFDVVTLQWASRHLRVKAVFGEIFRVLKPGGRFYHCDLMRPSNPVVDATFCTYLRASLWLTGLLFRSSAPVRNCRKYFVDALRMFYSVDELSEVLRERGFDDVSHRTALAGMVGFHRAVKRPPR